MRNPDCLRMTTEHKSSQTCSHCLFGPMDSLVHGVVLRKNGQPFTYSRTPGGTPIPRAIWGIKQCCNPPSIFARCPATWNRDFNAAINMWHIRMGIDNTGLPPPPFRR